MHIYAYMHIYTFTFATPTLKILVDHRTVILIVMQSVRGGYIGSAHRVVIISPK